MSVFICVTNEEKSNIEHDNNRKLKKKARKYVWPIFSKENFHFIDFLLY